MPTAQPRAASVTRPSTRPADPAAPAPKPPRAVTAAEALEVLRGYLDGLLGEPEPGGNRTHLFQLGWRHGTKDRELRPNGGAEVLARAIRKLDAACR